MSKKYLYVIANYPDWRQDFYAKHMRPRNKEYCQLHGFEYIEFNGGEDFFRGHPTWWKFSKVLDYMRDGFLKEGDTLTHLDADMCIVDGRVPRVARKSFTYSIDSCNTHCMGLYSIKVNEWSFDMLNNLLSEERYQRLKDKVTIGSMNEQSSFWEIFREQASWYSLAGVKRHSWEPFLLLPHFGWHSEYSEDTVYSLPELYDNVDILDPNWNVTEIPDEDGGNTFYINPTRASDVIVRHFAGGRKWREDYFERPLIK